MTLKRAARRPAGRIFLTASKVSNRASREERLIEIMVDAFGASPEEKKQLEDMVRALLPESIARLRRQARAPRSMAEMASEYALLVEEMGRQRRARAANWSRNGGPPQARRTEYEGTASLTGQDFEFGKVGAPSPGGYTLEKDLIHRAKLTEEQVFLLREFVGRPLGVISVWPKGFGAPIGVDLAEMWNKAAARSGAAQGHLNNAKRIMTDFEAEVRNGTRLMEQADAAARAGHNAEAAALGAAYRASATAADALRRNAKTCGDRAYSNVRDMFWNDVHRNPDLIAHFEQNMGLKFRRDSLGRPTGTPYLDLGNGREGLTLEHMIRRNDDPRLAITAENLVVSPWTENVMLNEGLRSSMPLQTR
jgi:hypothetical protein